MVEAYESMCREDGAVAKEGKAARTVFVMCGDCMAKPRGNKVTGIWEYARQINWSFVAILFFVNVS